MNDTRYLYEVRPVRPIVIAGKSIRRPCSIQLTKVEVLEYMKSAAIYRRFANSEPVKVTGENLDALHQQTYNPNYKSVVSVPTFAVSKEDTVTPPQEPEKTEPVVEQPVQKSEEEEDAGKKSKEEESSVISSKTSEDHDVETPATEEVTETIESDEENLEGNDSSSDEEENTEAPEETVATKEDETEQPVQAAAVPSINLKGNNGNKNKNHYNGNIKNYKK